MVELLRPMMVNLGGHVVLGLAGLATLLALVGVLARDAERSGRPGTGGYVLSFVGVAAFSVGNLAEGIWLAEFGVVLFGVGLMILTVGVVVLEPRREAGEGAAGWGRVAARRRLGAFLPVANSPTVFGFTFFAPSLLAAGMLGVGWVAVGYALWSGRRASIEQPAPRVS